MQLFLIFIFCDLAATPSCSPGPKEAGRGAFSAIQRISARYEIIYYATQFDFKLTHVVGTNPIYRFYDFYPRNEEEYLEKIKFSNFTTSRGKIRPSLKPEEATLICSTSSNFPKNENVRPKSTPK